MTSISSSGVLLLGLALLGGCDLFSLRDPEPPIVESGTFRQPDTPEQVVENVKAAVVEMNAANYTRSLATGLEFNPTAAAEQRDPIWSGWSRGEEQTYFTQLAAAANPGGEHRLELTDETLTALSEDRYSLETAYVLTVQHNRAEIPNTVQGRLFWSLVQGPDGQWRIQEWTDREVGTAPSWSDLKAAFSK